MRFWGVFIVGRVDIRSLAWRVFPCREDLHYYAYLAGSFLVGIPLIRVSRGAQDVSLYIHAWRPSKAMSDSSKVYLSPSASFCQLLILSMHSGHLSQMSLISRRTCNRRLYGVVVYEGTSKVVGFVRTVSFVSCEWVYQTFRVTLITRLARSSYLIQIDYHCIKYCLSNAMKKRQKATTIS